MTAPSHALSVRTASEDLEALLHKVYLHDVHPDQAKAVIARFIVELTQAVRLEAIEECAKIAEECTDPSSPSSSLTEYGKGRRQAAQRIRYLLDLAMGRVPVAEGGG